MHALFRILSVHSRSRWPIRLLLAWLMACCGSSASAHALQLDRSSPYIEAWPALSLATETGRRLELLEAQQLSFSPPSGPRASLGLHKQAVWLRLPLQVAARDDGHWVLNIDYAPLNHIEVYVLQQGRLLQRAELGNMLPAAQRPLASRAHALPLNLVPGASAELLLRLQSQGALIVPISLSKPPAFIARALGEQMLQGLLNGLGLALLAYSLIQALTLRQSFFAKYALLISGSLLFSLLQSGTGAQFIWTDSVWMERHIGGLAALMAICGSFLFMEQALEGAARRFSLVMKGGAALSLLIALVYALDLIDTHAVTALISALGLAPALLSLPAAWRRARAGDAIGVTLLLAWLAYLASTAVAIGVIKGQLAANFWTLHAFQFGATFDMLMFMRVLSLRHAASSRAAVQAGRERELLHALAHTDALTGLANRRGLQQAMDQALAQCGPERGVALFLLDLNDFKRINDEYGHEVGDELLCAIAGRLQAKLPPGDLVARLGGDEFVVLCPELSSGEQAEAVGERLLEAFSAPFKLSRQQLEIGVAIGQATAPQDGQDLARLLHHADTAMYRGKPGHARRKASSQNRQQSAPPEA